MRWSFLKIQFIKDKCDALGETYEPSSNKFCDTFCLFVWAYTNLAKISFVFMVLGKQVFKTSKIMRQSSVLCQKNMKWKVSTSTCKQFHLKTLFTHNLIIATYVCGKTNDYKRMIGLIDIMITLPLENNEINRRFPFLIRKK